MNEITPRQFLEMFVEKCPCYDKPRPDCPLSELYVESDLIARKKLLAGMSEEKLNELYQQHLLCVKKICGV